MTGRWLRLAFVLALLALSGHFVLEWRYAGTQQVSVRLAPPALPESPARVNGSMLQEILTHNILDRNRGRASGKDAEVQGWKKRSDRSWRLLATAVRQLHAPVAVILEGGKMESVHEGDILPDGARLLQVMRDGVAVKKDGKEHNVYLFGRK